MKLFKIDYRHTPSGPESSVVYAKSEQEASDFAKDETNQKIESIEEIKIAKGIIYTGHYCC